MYTCYEIRYSFPVLRIPDLEEPAANVFNLCSTVNCIAVYGITISRAGTLPRQKPCHKARKLRIDTCICKSEWQKSWAMLMENNAIGRKEIYRWHHKLSSYTGKPSSLKISLVAWNIPVYFDGADIFLRTKAHEDVGSSWTY